MHIIIMLLNLKNMYKNSEDRGEGQVQGHIVV